MNKNLLLSLSLVGLITTGCQKDKDQFIPYPLDGQISELIGELLEEPSTYQINTNTYNSINVDKTFRLIVASNSITNAEEENFSIDWTYAESAVQMELHGLPNYSNGKYLSPAFTFKLNSKDEININQEEPLALYIESDQVEDQNLFYMSSEGWIELGTQNMIITEWSDENGFAKSGFKVLIDNFGWYTIASKVDLGSNAFSNFCIELEGQYTQSNSKSLVALENDIIVPMNRSVNQGLFCTSMNIPDNQPFKLISMSNIREGEYELFYFEAVMENGLMITPSLEPKTIQEIKDILKDI